MSRFNGCEKNFPLNYGCFVIEKCGVMKWDKVRNNITGECTTFVDDGNCTGETEEHAWRVQRRFTTAMQYRGIQNAARKTKPPGQENTGSWAGGMMEASNSTVSKFISKAKWEKTKAILKRIGEEIETSPDGKLEFKQLERDRGYLIHVAPCYKHMTPFLKGIHQTIEIWQPNRNKDTDKE